jgi:hypothetical protein
MHADDSIRNLIRSAAQAAHDTPPAPHNFAPVQRSIRPAPRLGLRAIAVAGTIAAMLVGVLIVRGQLNRPSDRLVQIAAEDGLIFPVDQPTIDLFEGWALPFPDEPVLGQSQLARAVRDGVITKVRSVQAGEGIAEFPTLSIELKTDSGDCVIYQGISSKDVSVGEEAIVQAGTPIGTTTLNPAGAEGIELRPGCDQPVDAVAVIKAIADKDRKALSEALDP